MEIMSIEPEEIEAPARDAVVFHSSPLRTFAAMVAVIVVAYLAAAPLVRLVVGNDDGPWWSAPLQAVVVGLLVASAVALSARSSITTWVRVSAAGLELAAQGSDPVLLDWDDIEHVVVRRAGLRILLEVTPVDLDRVHPVDGAGPGWPAMTETADGPAFIADLTQIWPGPRVLRRELLRRMRT
jgi:hypothetical protein